MPSKNAAGGGYGNWTRAGLGMGETQAGGEHLAKIPMVFFPPFPPICFGQVSPSSLQPLEPSLPDPGGREDVAGSEEVPGEAALLQEERE